MDPRIDPLDDAGWPEIVDLLRRSDFSDALVLFGRLVRLAHNQGQIDAYVGVIQRVANGSVEDGVRQALEGRAN